MNINNYIFSKAVFLVAIIHFHSCKESSVAPVEESQASTSMESIVQLTDAQFKNADLRVAIPEKRKVGHVIQLNGKIEVMPENTITISSPMAGFVRQIKWMPGMLVTKGQTLVRLEEKEYIQLQQNYLSAKNALSFAKLDFERQSALSKNQAVSDKVFQMAEEKVKQNQISLRALGEQLKLIHINPETLSAENLTSQIVISAPVSGTITEVNVNSGKYVQAGDAMIKMIDNNGSRLVLKAFEKDLPYLKTGQNISAYSNTQSDKIRSGKVQYIVKSVGDQGFAQVICTLDGGSSEILPGTYMNADIESQSVEVWTVPTEALVTFEGKEYVFIEKGSQSYQMVEIKPGQTENGRLQVINYQVFADKKIVTNGAYTLLMKMKNVAE